RKRTQWQPTHLLSPDRRRASLLPGEDRRVANNQSNCRKVHSKLGVKMDAIKSYLENMFLHLPKSPEVMRAKDELSQMMEDKYNQLRSEGRTDNEAVGQVIAEFGNLDELAENLGISNEVGALSTETEQINMTDEDVERYLKVTRESGTQV